MKLEFRHREVLDVVEEHEPIPGTEIAMRLSQSYDSVNHTLRYLESHGFVSREDDGYVAE